MATYRCTVAGSTEEIRQAQRLRWQVYGEEERMLPRTVALNGREVDARDEGRATSHLLIFRDSESVGTVRLVRAGGPGTASDVRAAGGLGLDLATKVNLDRFARPDIALGEVTRYCVLRQYRCTAVTHALWQALRAESRRLGITHWVAGANMETNAPEDADLAYQMAKDQGLLSDQSCAALSSVPAPSPPTRRLYTDEQHRRAAAGDRRGLELPRVLSLFAKRMGARFIGRPIYAGFFAVFALPLVVSLAEATVPRPCSLGGIPRRADHAQSRLSP